jgi:hypothetical protein
VLRLTSGEKEVRGDRKAHLAGLLHELADNRLRLTHLRHREGAHLVFI